jgi:nucleoside 2-deoxyribosyltransferase-like protein
MIKVYIAGAWAELHDRARPMIAACKTAGIVVTQDWTLDADKTPEVERDSDHSVPVRIERASGNLAGIRQADYLWLLAPETKGSCGAWVELGYALALRSEREYGDHTTGLFGGHPRVVVSGAKNRRSVFTELADRLFDTDQLALAWLIDQHVDSQSPSIPPVLRHPVPDTEPSL